MFQNSCKDSFKGYLQKWTNYVRGYQKRWFVLANGCLSYYRNPNEVNHTCRGTINLATSTIKIQDPCTIVISNEANQTFHLKAFSESDTHLWVTALHLAKETAIKMFKAEESDYDIPICSQAKSTPTSSVQQIDKLSLKSDFCDEILPDNYQIQKDFSQRLYDLNTSVSIVKKNSDQLSNLLREFNTIYFSNGAANYSINSELSFNNDVKSSESLSSNHQSIQCLNRDPRSPPHSVNPQYLEFIKNFKEKNKAFNVSVQACVILCTEFVSQIPIFNSQYQKLINYEREHKLRLGNMVEELAKQLGALEKKAARQFEFDSAVNSNPNSKLYSKDEEQMTNFKQQDLVSSESDEDCFFDALEDEHMFHVSLPRIVPQNNLHLPPQHTVNEYESCSSDSEYEKDHPKSSTLARVIVRSTQKKIKTTQNVEKVPKDKLKDKVSHSHRRTASTGIPSSHFNYVEMVNQSMRETAKIKSSLEVPKVMTTSQDGGLQSNNLLLNVKTTSDLKTAKSVPSLPMPTEKKLHKERRKTIPPRPNLSISLWGIMKNCIGKELSKIPVPVNFNEPLSMIQRLTEDFEYSECLDEAAACKDSIEQMALVAAFTVSSYSTTTNRTGKPFNPLLGETFECDRTDDMGWRSVAEQVSHHPPAAALYCASDKGWNCSQEFTMSSKFRGKYLAIIPLGIAHLRFNESNNHYTWRKVTSTVHNIIVGKLWIDNHGEMDIYNHTTGDTCHLTYTAYSYFSREPARRVSGTITDKNGVTKYVLNGTWDDKFEGAKVLEIRKDKNDQQIFETGPARVLWKRIYPPDYTAEMYNFTEFAITLNEPEDGVAPTDSRLRPDQRLMENGSWDEANTVKEALEEKQRDKRRKVEKENEQRKRAGQELVEHKPTWFTHVNDPVTDMLTYVYNDRYWECKKSGSWGPEVPSIF